MEYSENLLNLINLSKFVLIGYTSKMEREKDLLLSNLPHIYWENPDIKSIKSFIRDKKLDQIFDGSKFKWIVFDASSIHDRIESKPIVLKNTIMALKNMIGNEYGIILTSPLIRRMTVGSMEHFVSGGSHPIYACDLFITIKDSGIEIIKNRHE